MRPVDNPPAYPRQSTPLEITDHPLPALLQWTGLTFAAFLIIFTLNEPYFTIAAVVSFTVATAATIAAAWQASDPDRRAAFIHPAYPMATALIAGALSWLLVLEAKPTGQRAIIESISPTWSDSTTDTDILLFAIVLFWPLFLFPTIYRTARSPPQTGRTGLFRRRIPLCTRPGHTFSPPVSSLPSCIDRHHLPIHPLATSCPA